MNKALIFALTVALLIGLGLAPAPAGAVDQRLVISGGPIGGTFNTFANAAAVYLSNNIPGVKAGAVGSGGSVDNIKLVNGGQSTLGLCYAVDSALGYTGRLPQAAKRYNNIRSLGFLYGAPAQLVVRADSKLTSAKELRGLRVAVGGEGSGAAASAKRFFSSIGVWDKFKPIHLGYSAAASAFKDGKLNAFWLLVGYPNRSIGEASVQVKIRLLDLNQEAMKSGFYQAYAYRPTTIPADTYYRGMPACATFQDFTILTTNKDVPAELVYKIMKALWSPKGMEAMVAAKKTFAAMSLKNNFQGASVPLHKGAYRFWQEQRVTVPENLKPVD